MFHTGMGESETRSNDVEKLRDEDEMKCKKEKNQQSPQTEGF